MINLNATRKFVLKFFILYIIFLLAGTLLNIDKKITNIYTKKGNDFFKTFANQKQVKFKNEKDQAWVLKIDVVNTKVGKKNWCTLNIWGIFYLPCTLYLSLMLCTKFKTRLSKFITFSVGFLLLFVFFYGFQYFKITYLFHTIDQTEPAFSGGLFYDAVYLLNTSFIDNANANFYLLIALLIWFIVAFQKQNFIQKLQ